MLAIVGVFLGWQAAISTALIAGLLLLGLAACCARFAERWMAGAILAAALVQLFLWRGLYQLDFWPGNSSNVFAITVWAAVLALLAVLAGWRLNVQQPRAEV
jgi:hypothetical protein